MLVALLIQTSVVYAQDENGIKIMKALWGTKDVTSEAAAFCDNQNVCDYKISTRFIGQHEGTNKIFEITWTCHGAEKEQVTIKRPHDDENRLVSIECTNVPKEISVVPKVVGTNPDINLDTVNYYKKLIKNFDRNSNEVQLEDFKKTFYPMDPAPLESNDILLKCNDRKAAGKCVPDTYYTWGPTAKMLNIKKASSSKNWGVLNTGGSLNRGVFMTHTPIGSYCYGELPIRLKFKTAPKKGVLNDSSFNNNYNEWVTVTGSNIGSISYAQPEHIDEIVTEIQRRLDEKNNWWNGALYTKPKYVNSLKERLLSGCYTHRNLNFS